MTIKLKASKTGVFIVQKNLQRTHISNSNRHGDYSPAINVARENLKDKFDKLNLDTKLAISKAKVLVNCRPVTVPIYHTSNYHYERVDEFDKPSHNQNYYYQRCGNPTCEAVEVQICELEGGAASITYNSGLAATNAVVMLLSSGDHLICQTPIYGGTENFIIHHMQRWGLQVTWVKAGENFVAEAQAAIKDNTKMIYMEVPCNPLMTTIDMISAIAMAKKHGLLTAVDATFSTPYLLQPIKYGMDIVVHSCSKFMGGHSDLIAGVITVADVKHWTELKRQQRMTGSALGAFDASLVLRGLKTLPVRMRHISASAMAIAHFLQKQPKIEKVYYPGLENDPGYKYASKIMQMFGGMIGVDLGSEEKAVRFVEATRIFVLAVSLGGTESTIEYPIGMTRGRELQKTSKMPIPEGIVRLSIGLEDVKDLIADLEQALGKL